MTEDPQKPPRKNLWKGMPRPARIVLGSSAALLFILAILAGVRFNDTIAGVPSWLPLIVVAGVLIIVTALSGTIWASRMDGGFDQSSAEVNAMVFMIGATIVSALFIIPGFILGLVINAIVVR